MSLVKTLYGQVQKSVCGFFLLVLGRKFANWFLFCWNGLLKSLTAIRHYIELNRKILAQKKFIEMGLQLGLCLYTVHSFDFDRWLKFELTFDYFICKTNLKNIKDFLFIKKKKCWSRSRKVGKMEWSTAVEISCRTKVVWFDVQKNKYEWNKDHVEWCEMRFIHGLATSISPFQYYTVALLPHGRRNSKYN